MIADVIRTAFGFVTLNVYENSLTAVKNTWKTFDKRR